MPTAWRLSKRRHAEEAVTGEGARLHGGRWNSVGVPMVYTSQHASLAVLEILVHLQAAAPLSAYVLRSVTFDDAQVEWIDLGRLPYGWRTPRGHDGCRRLGDEWIARASAPVLAVPSAVVPREANFLLDPAHPDFPSLVFGPAEPFDLDPRLGSSELNEPAAVADLAEENRTGPRLAIGRTWNGETVGAGEAAAVELASEGEHLVVRVDAPFHGDPPPPGPPGPTPRLWEHEVVELFVAGAGEPVPYLEVELGPHGHHLVLRLAGTRHVVEQELPLDYRAAVEGDRWRGEARLPRSWLPPPPHRVNAYAVHGSGAVRRYLAMQPLPGPQADFHQPERFPRMVLPDGRGDRERQAEPAVDDEGRR